MIKLDYQTDNPRWGWSGMEFSDWNSFSLIIGFLSNIQHFKGYGTGLSLWNNSISVHIERNDKQGAWNKEGRIHYYKNYGDLAAYLCDLKVHSSSGNTGITCRINSNGYILSLINDFQFIVRTYTGYSTADIFPPNDAVIAVKSILENALVNQELSQQEIQSCLVQFDAGFHM